MIEFIWRKERATPQQLALIVLLLLAPTALRVPMTSANESSAAFPVSLSTSIWAAGQFSGVLVSWVACLSIVGAIAALVRYVSGGVTRAPRFRIAYWTLPVMVTIAVELSCATRIARLSSVYGGAFTWIDGFIAFPIALVVVSSAFLASRRGPTSGVFALALGEWIARDLSTFAMRGPDLRLALFLALRLGLFALSAFALARVGTKADDLPRAGLGWAAQPADALLLPWGAGWLVDQALCSAT